MDLSICENGVVTTDRVVGSRSEKTADVICSIIDRLNTESFDVAIRHVFADVRENFFPECDGFIASHDQETVEILTLEKRVTHAHNRLNNIFGYTIRNNCIYISNQAEEDVNVSVPSEHIRVRNVITVPLRHQQVVGVICLANKSNDFTVEDARILVSVSKVLSIYMWNYLEVRLRDMSLIHKLNTSVRTPMMSISGSIDILKRTLTRPEKDVLHILSIIEMSARNVTTILEDIVYYSDLTTNRIVLRNQNFKVSELLSEAVYEIKGKKNEINLNNHLLQDSVYTDRRLLKYVLSALLNNANMYTENGTIRITTDLSPVEGDPSKYRTATLQIQVEDTGVGIPFQNQDLVFNEFYRGNLSEDNQYTSGLKLPICKRICNRLNGDIKAVSNLLSGTTFTATIEVKVTPDTNHIMEHFGSQLRRGTVLVIQNNVETRLNIYNAYMSYGIPVYLCSSLRDVYEFSRLHEISLLITDTPDIETLSNELATREINCLICSTYRQHLSSTTSPKYSRFYTLDTKNFDRIDLLLMTLSAVTSQENSPLSAPRTGRADRSILAVEDNPDNLYMLTQMLHILGYHNVTTAADGGEALNLLLRNNYDVVLIDNMMPGMTGIEVATEFGNLCKEPLTHFAIISAGITDSDTTTLHTVGVTHTLMKPYGLDELRTLLSNI